MSTTATLGLTNLDPGQNQKEVTINGNMTLLDDFAAGLLAVTTKTATATLLKTEGVILSNHSAAATYTLPGTGAGVVPKIGQRFIVRDVSGNAGVNNITLAAPGGNRHGTAGNGAAARRGGERGRPSCAHGGRYQAAGRGRWARGAPRRACRGGAATGRPGRGRGERRR